MADVALINDSNIITNTIVIPSKFDTDERARAYIKLIFDVSDAETEKYILHMPDRSPWPIEVGGFYDAANNILFQKKPYASWTPNTTTKLWDPPIARPSDGQRYNWDETKYQDDGDGWVLCDPQY